MERGFIVDYAHGGAIHQSRWVPGSPKPNSFFKISDATGEQLASCHSVTSFRCSRCGLLESYAQPLVD